MALIQTCDPSRFDYSALVILFITSYFIVSKWWPITEWNKSYLFSARKFRQQLNNSGTKLLLSGLDMTLFTALHTCDVSHHVPKSDHFQNGRRLSVKKFRKFDFVQYIINLLI